MARFTYDKSNITNARKLRTNMTKEERHLWYDYLRDCSVKFQRQKMIGNYIVDFYCSSLQLVIELDGSQHYQKIELVKDDERTRYLNSCGIQVLRIPNNEITGNFAGVCQYIDNLIRTIPPARFR